MSNPTPRINRIITISLVVSILVILALLILPYFARAKEIHGSNICAANLRGIMNNMVIYADSNNGQFPTVTYVPYSPVLNSPTATVTFTDPADTINAYYTAPYPQAGSVTANLWILTLQGMSPKLFICKQSNILSDPYVTGPAEIRDAHNNYYDNFQNDKQLSYSFAYPWKADGSVGKWWRNTGDATLPLASDMAPQQGTGNPRRILNPASAPRNNKTWNSANHAGIGQNVVFADLHVDYATRPTVGHMNDNIFTTGPALGGIPATKSPPNLTADSPPDDIIMYPIRNLDTGRL